MLTPKAELIPLMLLLGIVAGSYVALPAGQSPVPSTASANVNTISDNIVQELKDFGTVFNSPAYWNGFVYVGPSPSDMSPNSSRRAFHEPKYPRFLHLAVRSLSGVFPEAKISRVACGATSTTGRPGTGFGVVVGGVEMGRKMAWSEACFSRTQVPPVLHLGYRRLTVSLKPADGEHVIRKRESDSFFGTTLQQELEKRGFTHLIIAGGMTEYCVDTTCRRATSLGYDVTLAGDAHLTRDNEVLTAANIIAHHNFVLNGFGAGDHVVRIRPTDQIVF